MFYLLVYFIALKDGIIKHNTYFDMVVVAWFEFWIKKNFKNLDIILKNNRENDCFGKMDKKTLARGVILWYNLAVKVDIMFLYFELLFIVSCFIFFEFRLKKILIHAVDDFF